MNIISNFNFSKRFDLRKLLSILLINSIFFINSTNAACSFYKASIWINNTKSKKKIILSDGFMHHCANIYKFNEGAKNDEISIRYWSCVSDQGCGNKLIRGYSAISINHNKWIPGKVSYSSYPNGLKYHILCVKQNDSNLEYCWKQGEFLR